MRQWVLASASPRRKEILSRLGLAMRIIPSKDEESRAEGLKPDELVCFLAKGKARSVAGTLSDDAIVIGADTLVFLNGERLGKPADEGEAFAMLRALSGKAHEVYTGVCIVDCGSGKEFSFAECTKVWFSEMSDREIRDYIATGEPMDKAGAYGIQGIASRFIERIEGNYDNVVGFPLNRFCTAVREMGLEDALDRADTPV